MKVNKKMFLGGVIGGAAQSLGGSLSNAALARIVGGKGAGKGYLKEELGIKDPSEGPSDDEEFSIKITKGGKTLKEAKKGAKMKIMKKGGMAGLSAAQKEVYRRGLAAYMSSGNRPKTSQHAWAMARVKSAFGKREAAKIASGKGKKKKK